jgi:integrase
MASIRQRGSKYHVQVRRRAYGSITKSFSTKRDAEAWARLMEVKLDRNELGTDRTILEQLTLGELVIRYRDQVTVTKKGWEQETWRLNAFLRHRICRKKLSKLSSVDFASYRDDRLKVVKPKSLKTELSPIHNLFEVARDEWGIPIMANPLDKVKLKAPDNRRERRLRDGELERILEAASNRQNPYIVPIILFALETAMRRGEILSLTWMQVDWKRSSATLSDSKNGHSRTIPLTPTAQQILGSIDPSSEKVFPTTANAVRLNWQRIIKDANIEDLHFHDLRHEAISKLFELGLTVPEVASISGHRDARMLLRYAHASANLVAAKLSRPLPHTQELQSDLFCGVGHE